MRTKITLLGAVLLLSGVLSPATFAKKGEPNPTPPPVGGPILDLFLPGIPKPSPNRPKKPANISLRAQYDGTTGTMTFLIDDEEGRIAYEVTGTAGDYGTGEVTFTEPSAELNLSPDSYAIQCTDQNGTLYYGEFELAAE